MPTTNHLIPEPNLDELREAVAKLSKRAKKISGASIEMSETFHHTETRTRKNAWGEGVEWALRFFSVTITGEAPKINGWRFVSALHFTPGGNVLVMTVPGEEIPAKYRKATQKCEHCKTDRRRGKVYVLRSDKGRTMQVGSACLVDFLGHKDPHAVAEWATTFSDLAKQAGSLEEEDAGWGGGSWGESSDPLWAYLAWVALVIRTEGWVSSTEARNSATKQPTASLARTLMDPDPQWDKQFLDAWVRKYGPENRTPSNADKALVAQVKEWAQGALQKSKVDNDYLHNLQVIAKEESVTPKTRGLAASMISAYKRAHAQELERKREGERSNEHVGKEGERAVFEVTVDAIIDISNDFGPKYLIRMSDPAGNSLVWFYSGSKQALAQGESYRIKGTVKEHGEYKGRKQTVLQRCAVEGTLATAGAK
jgi:ribosomal protein L36